MSKDSELVNVGASIRAVAETTNIQYPARLNVEGLVRGQTTFMPQWPQLQTGERWGDVTLDLEIPEGHLEVLTKGQFV
jgi:hypothetical protein